MLDKTNTNKTQGSEKWFTNFGKNTNAEYRLICFPFSGGGSNVFREWPTKLQNTEVLALRLPGRESRFTEPAISNLEQLIETIAPIVRDFMDKPCFFLGHSMGALIVFELARYMEKHYQRSPSSLFVSAFRSPERKNKKRLLHPLSDREFVEELRDYGGTNMKILDNIETMKLLTPMLRSDFALHETYQFYEAEQLNCPIHAFYGTQDEITGREEMEGWGQYSHEPFTITAVQGGHFFVNTAADTLCQAIRNTTRAPHLVGLP